MRIAVIGAGTVGSALARAKATVAALLAAIGFRPLDAGPLRMARTLEHMGLLNISINARYGWPWESGWKLLGPTA